MAQVYNRLTLDVKKKNHDIITAVQHDAASRYLDINLIDNGVNINLTGHEVRLYARKPDQQEIFNNGQITNAEQGRVQIELTSQLLAKEGYVEAQVITYRNNQQILSTLPFKIHVVSNLMSDNSIESSNEYGALVILYQNLYEAYDLMTTMIQNIGTPGANAQELNLNTMFEVWDWLVDYLKRNSSAGVMDSLTQLHTKADGLDTKSTEIKNLATTTSEDLANHDKEMKYLQWLSHLYIDGGEYIHNDPAVYKEFMLNSKCLAKSYSATQRIISHYTKMTPSEREQYIDFIFAQNPRLESGALKALMYNTNSYATGSYFFQNESSIDLIRRVLEKPMVTSMIVDKTFPRDYFFGGGYGVMARSQFEKIVNLAVGSGKTSERLFDLLWRSGHHKGTTDSDITLNNNLWGMTGSRKLVSDGDIKQIYKKVKSLKGSKFELVYQGYLNSERPSFFKNSYGYELYQGINKINSGYNPQELSNAQKKDLDENYIIFARPEKSGSNNVQSGQVVMCQPSNYHGGGYESTYLSRYTQVYFTRDEIENASRRAGQALSNTEKLFMGTGNMWIGAGSENEHIITRRDQDTYFSPGQYQTQYFKVYAEIYKFKS